MFGAPNVGKRSRYKRSLTKLALEVHWTSNLSEFPLRVAFARYALSASAGRRAHVWRVEHINKNPADESAGFCV